MAKNFLKQKQHILSSKNENKKKIIRSSTIPEIIDLDDEMTKSQSSYVCKTVVDLTEAGPELIILDETVNQLSQTINKLNASLSDIEIIDLSNSSFSSQRRRKRCRSEVETLKNIEENIQINPVSPSDSFQNSGGKAKQSKCNSRKRKRKNRNGSGGLTISINNTSGSRSVKNNKKNSSSKRSLSLSKSIETPKKKKRKLQDVSNLRSSVISPAKPLTGNILEYYSKLNSAVENVKKRELLSERKKLLSKLDKHTSIQNYLKGERQRKHLNNQKRNFNVRGHTPRKERKPFVEKNIFNPNPIDVDKEGLRPVVVDGSNIARGHGRGSFSVKGIQICVDYFARRGNNIIKVFLPLHCEEYFSNDQLAELKSKCDVIFTPSQFINGVRKSSYDDRFIVQYAVEFGGVIVSTDNYRDLMKENPRWRDTIQKRLLMFTWVDDFLMFPMDPLGKNGPTLEEFLRF